MHEEASQKVKRQYPKFYERFIPFAIGILVLVVVAMLVFTVAIGTGMLVLG